MAWQGKELLRAVYATAGTAAAHAALERFSSNFTSYRLRLLLHCGVRWQTHRTARLRGRSPRLVA